jgi:hypothetical protein
MKAARQMLALLLFSLASIAGFGYLAYHARFVYLQGMFWLSRLTR